MIHPEERIGPVKIFPVIHVHHHDPIHKCDRHRNLPHRRMPLPQNIGDHRQHRTQRMMIQPVPRQHQSSEPAAKRHQNEHRNHKRHRQHTGARIPQPRRPSRDHIHHRRNQRDQIRDLRIIRKDLPLPLANADAEAQQL